MEHENFTTWLSFAFSTTVQLNWANSHFLFPLWLLVPVLPHLHPDISYSAACLPIWALGWPHSWEEACKLCSGWTAPDKWVCVPQVHSCRGVLATHGSLCCGGLGQRFSTYVCLDIFKVRAKLWFKYLTLYEGGWGFQETFLWFIKEKKPEENDQKTKWQSDSLAVFLVCLFGILCVEN